MRLWNCLLRPLVDACLALSGLAPRAGALVRLGRVVLLPCFPAALVLSDLWCLQRLIRLCQSSHKFGLDLRREIVAFYTRRSSPTSSRRSTMMAQRNEGRHLTPPSCLARFHR